MFKVVVSQDTLADLSFNLLYDAFELVILCIDKVVVVKVSVCMQFMCEMMHVSVGQELGERVKHTKRLHLQLTIAIY